MSIDQLREYLKDYMYENQYSLSRMAELTGRSIHLLETIIVGNHVGLSEEEHRKIAKSLILDNESALILLKRVEQELPLPKI